MGIAYILLKEQGIDSLLCIGEVQRQDKRYFDHSWIEINDSPYDIAIQLTFDEEKNAPVYAGYDLDSGQPTQYNYRFKMKGIDFAAKKVYETPLAKYLDGAPEKVGWAAVERIGKTIGLSLKREYLRNTYKDTKRILITP